MIASAPAEVVRRQKERRSPAESYNLLRSLDELGALLPETIAGGFWVDAFLVAAGMQQILQDELHPDPFRLDEAAGFLGSEVVEGIGQIVQFARQPFLGRDVQACERELAGLVDVLAGAIVRAPPDAAGLLRRVAGLRELLQRLAPATRASVLRLPACFHDFDQRPEDVARLARDFAVRFPDRSRRLLVVGVRTSGSYLAPLQAACLREEGFDRVEVMTVRPGRRLLRAERLAVQRVARDGGLALIVDDPPGSGKTLARVAEGLERHGFPAESVVLILQLFEGQVVPPALSGYASVCLPWSEWAVHGKLSGSAATAGRGHARALSGTRDAVVVASGVGLGYLGALGPAVARALPGYVPEARVADGVLSREWLPEERRADPADLPEAIGDYVAARAAALPVREDFSLRLAGEFPAWEVASNLLTRAFGRAGPAMKLLGIDAAVKRLLRVTRHSLVDGWTEPSEWFRAAGGGPLVKVGFHERSFWHLGLAGFDPLLDLAGAAAGQEPGFVETLQHAYEARSGDAVDPERFLLYELAHLSSRERLDPERKASLRRAQAAAVRRYVRERFLSDASAAADGPLCALDLDGVLETEHLGFPSTTRSGALALRGLIRHGYRPLIASGRSAEDVADRCAGYGLLGGVAEYGGAIVAGGVVRSLLTGEMAAALDRLRTDLAATEGIRLDPLYRHSVRASRIDGAGRRRGLDETTIDRAVSGGKVRAIRGESQTDFVPAGIDKATGLTALFAELSADRELAFAVGDTAADLPMLGFAHLAAAPGHAGPALRRAGIRRTRRPYQAGLAQAVGLLLGHVPGSCPVCRPGLESRTELLMTILSAQERGARGIVRAALRLRRQA